MPSDAAAPAPARLGTLVRRASRGLSAANVEDPRREAFRLVADLLGTNPGDVVLGADRAAPPELAERLDDAVARRRAGEPLAYVLGSAGFRGLELAVDRRVLIPRPETEGLLERALALVRTGVVADIGTGSGCIACAARQEGQYDRVVGIDVCPDALGVAGANRDRLGLAVELVRGDLTAPLGAESVDLLVANPPYVSDEEWRHLEPGVRDFEPRVALTSGADGLEATRRLLADGRRVVRPGGAIVIEVAADRAVVSAEIARGRGWTGVRVDEDWSGRPRYLVALWSET